MECCWRVAPAPVQPGTYRTFNGNEAVALGLLSAARLADKPLLYSSYPITPASEILHHLSRWKHLDARTIQAEDEIAAMGASIGANMMTSRTSDIMRAAWVPTTPPPMTSTFAGNTPGTPPIRRPRPPRWAVRA